MSVCTGARINATGERLSRRAKATSGFNLPLALVRARTIECLCIPLEVFGSAFAFGHHGELKWSASSSGSLHYLTNRSRSSIAVTLAEKAARGAVAMCVLVTGPN